MKKRMICIFLGFFLLLLSGCGEKELFRRGFEQLQELSVLHVRNEQYLGDNFGDLKLLTVRNEWRNGEDFYWEGDDGTKYLSYGERRWTIEPQQHTQWKQQSYPIEAHSKWWNNHEPETFLEGTVSVRREGEYIVLEQNLDLGSANCTLSRQISTTTFYMRQSGEIARITLVTVTYNGYEIDAEDIRSVSKHEYYITPLDAAVAEEKIQAQHQTVRPRT